MVSATAAILTIACAALAAQWSAALLLAAALPLGLLAVAIMRRRSSWLRRSLLIASFVIALLLAGLVFAALKPHAPTRVIALETGGTGTFLAAEDVSERHFADVVTAEGSLLLVDPQADTRTKIGHGDAEVAYLFRGGRKVLFWRDSTLYRWDRSSGETALAAPANFQPRIGRDGRWLAYWDESGKRAAVEGLETEATEYLDVDGALDELVICDRGAHVSLPLSGGGACAGEPKDKRLDVWMRASEGWRHGSRPPVVRGDLELSPTCRFLVSRLQRGEQPPFSVWDLVGGHPLVIPENAERLIGFNRSESELCFLERMGEEPGELRALVCQAIAAPWTRKVVARRVRASDLHWAASQRLAAYAAECSSGARESCDLQIFDLDTVGAETVAQSVDLRVGKLSPDANWLTAFDSARRMAVISRATHVAQHLPLSVAELSPTVFSPDGRRVAVLGAEQNLLMLWDLVAATGMEVARDVHRRFSFSPDGKRLVFIAGGPQRFRVPFGAADNYGSLTVFDAAGSSTISETASDFFLLTDRYLAYSTVPTHYPFGSGEIRWHAFEAASP